MADVPVVLVVSSSPIPVVRLLARSTGHRLRAAVADLVDAAVGAVPDLRLAVVAGLLVVPVDEVDVAVGAVLQVDELRPGVVGQQEVRAVVADVAACPSASSMSTLSRWPWMLPMKSWPRYSFGQVPPR